MCLEPPTGEYLPQRESNLSYRQCYCLARAPPSSFSPSVFMSSFFPTCRCISVNLAAELISQLGLRHVNLTEKGRTNVAPVTENLQNLRSDKTIYTQSHHLSFTSRRQLWLCVESLCLFWSVLLTRWLLSVRRAADGSRQFNGLPHVLQRVSLIVTIWCPVTEMDQNMYLPLIFVYTVCTLYIAMSGFQRPCCMSMMWWCFKVNPGVLCSVLIVCSSKFARMSHHLVY